MTHVSNLHTICCLQLGKGNTVYQYIKGLGQFDTANPLVIREVFEDHYEASPPSVTDKPTHNIWLSAIVMKEVVSDDKFVHGVVNIDTNKQLDQLKTYTLSGLDLTTEAWDAITDVNKEEKVPPCTFTIK